MILQKYKPEVNTLLPGDERSDNIFAVKYIYEIIHICAAVVDESEV